MKSIKQILLGAFLTVSAFTAVLYTSCTKDACKNVTCNNGGTCSGGNCTCTTGYEGTSCETQSRTKFIKSWSASDLLTGGTSPIPYTSAIVAGVSTDVTQVLIADFSDFFTNTVTASISGSTITISSQNPDGNHYNVSGSGTLANGKITWNYTIKNDSTSVTQVYSGTWQ